MIEFAFNRVCSALGIGPRVVNRSYGLVCFEDAVQFQMERCASYSKCKLDEARIARRLKYCLKLMHSFGLIHKDIKPQNIAYSKTTKDLVLIDFGMSKVVLEQLGSKSLTCREGTPNYMSPDMHELTGKGMVDLYYNDLWALKTSIKNMSQANWSVPHLPKME